MRAQSLDIGHSHLVEFAGNVQTAAYLLQQRVLQATVEFGQLLGEGIQSLGAKMGISPDRLLYAKNPRHLIEIAGIFCYLLCSIPSRISLLISVCFGFPSRAFKMSRSVWLFSFSPTKVVFSFVHSFRACVSAMFSPFYIERAVAALSTSTY